MLAGFLVEIGAILTGMILVLTEVVVCSVCNAPKLAPTEGEEELKVGGCLGIEAKLLGRVVAESKIFVLHAKVKKPLVTEVFPIIEPLKVGAGLAEELKLHLLKLSCTESEITGSDLVSEALTYSV